MHSIKKLIYATLIVSLTSCSTWRASPSNNSMVEISGIVKSYNLDRRGNVESFLLNTDGKLIQINLPRDKGGEITQAFPLNSTTTVHVLGEPSSKDISVFSLNSYQSQFGEVVDLSTPPFENKTEIHGVIAAYNRNRHGDVDALILANGDFVEMEPRDFRYGDFPLGKHISSHGDFRTMLNGRKFIKAYDLER